MMEAVHSSKPSVLTRATRCDIPKDGILHSHRRENLRSCIFKRGCHEFGITRVYELFVEERNRKEKEAGGSCRTKA
jgi:hypothetical protein